MRKILYFVIGLASAAALFAGTIVSATDYGLGATAQASGLTKFGSSVPEVVGTIIGAGLSLISVVFFVLIVYGGITYMTARGESEKTQKGINTIIAATIGIVIVMGAYALTNFVFNIGSATPAPNQPPTTTQTVACGDGVIAPESDEVCDDKNSVNGDGCSSTCKIEAGWNCALNSPSTCQRI